MSELTGLRAKVVKIMGGTQYTRMINGWETRIDGLEEKFKQSQTVASKMLALRNTVDQLALRDSKEKAQRITNPISHRQTWGGSGGEVISFPGTIIDKFISDVLGNSTSRPMIQARKQEMTRNGLELKSVFVSKCPQCDVDYEQIITECDNCEYEGEFITPSEKEKEIGEEWIEDKHKVNCNNQKLLDIIEEYQEFVDIIDDGWWGFENSYVHYNGIIVSYEIKEIWVIHPGNIAWSVHPETNKIGKYEYTCVQHRDFTTNNPDAQCKCGNILYPVVAVRYRPGTQTIIFRYIPNEILHGSLYRPSALYGFPPALTLRYELALTTNQMKFMSDYYDEVNYHKIPGYLLLPTTQNWNEVWTQAKELRRQVEMDSHAIGVLPYDPQTGGKPEFIRFDTTPKEMEFISTRDEARQRMSALYGVSPILQADNSAGGGLNNEGLQFTVTNRAIAKAQQAISRNLLAPLSEMLGLKDWVISLVPNEEQDEVAEIDLKIKIAQYAQSMVNLGFGVKLDSDGTPQITEAEEKEADPYEDLYQEGGPEGEGKSSDKFEGAPESPDHGIDGLDEFEKMKEPYSFIEEYPDWPWKDDYDIVTYHTIPLADINSNPDFEITEEDIENGSPRVRPKTIIYYLTETDEMSPLIVDQNYNLLDGNHRKYVLDKKRQKNVKVAVVEASDRRKMSVKAQLRAPKGGVTIHGKFYKGGLFIPGDVQDDMTEDEKDAVRAGKDVGGVDSEGDGKENPEADKPEKKYLKEYRREIKQEMKAKLKVAKTGKKNMLKQVKKIDKTYNRQYKKMNILREKLNRTEAENEMLISLRTELFDLGSEKLTMEDKINQKQRNIDLYTDTRRYPDYALADKYSEILSQMNHAKYNVDNKNTWERHIKLLGAEIETIKKAIKNKDISIYDTDFLPLDTQEGLDEINETLMSVEVHYAETKRKLDNYDKDKKFLEENKQTMKVLKRLRLRKDGEHWGYYKKTKMKEFEAPGKLFAMVVNEDKEAIETLFNEEVAWAKERLNIKGWQMPELILEFNPTDIGANTLGYSDFTGRTIALNLNSMKRDPHGLQEIIRHEVAHFFDKLGSAPDYWKLHNDWERLKEQAYTQKGQVRWETMDKLNDIENKIFTYSQLFTNDRVKSNEDSKFSEGHGSKWQDTMEVLFGVRPKHRYYGGIGAPVEV